MPQPTIILIFGEGGWGGKEYVIRQLPGGALASDREKLWVSRESHIYGEATSLSKILNAMSESGILDVRGVGGSTGSRGVLKRDLNLWGVGEWEHRPTDLILI